MMKKLVSFMILFCALILVGCSQMELQNLNLSAVDLTKINNLDEEQIRRISENAVICNPPYMRLGLGCCLDQNNNRICDVDENTQTVDPEQVSPGTTPSEQVNTQNDQSPIGVNIAGPLGYASTEWVLLDQMKTSSHWLTQTNSGEWDTSEQGKLDLDENGWLRSLTPRDGQSANYDFVSTYMMASDHHPEGQYIVLYDGEGRIEYRLNGVKNAQLSRPGRDVIDFDDPTAGGLLLMIKETDPNNNGNYIRNIRVLPPGGICNNRFTYAPNAAGCDGQFTSFEENYQTQIFHPAFLNDIRKYNALRFMQFFDITNQPPGTWTNRAKPTDVRDGQGKGSPIETAIAMSNAVNANAWLNLPYSADDEYVRNAARLTKDNLNSNLNIFVEYSNEVWNFAHPYNIGNDWIEAQAQAEWPNAVESDGSPVTGFRKRMNWYGKRSAEICNIWKQEFGSENNRVKCVMNGQIGWTDINQEALGCRLHVAEGGSICSSNMDYFATAPYFGVVGEPSNVGMIRTWMTESDGGFTSLFNYAEQRLDNVFSDVNNDIQLANQHGLSYIAYEGGQHFVWSAELRDTPDIRDFFIEANRHPRIGELYLQYLNRWKQAGAGLFMHYSSVVSYSKYGSWGAKEYQLQPRSQAPKYDALMTFIDNNLCWWHGCDNQATIPTPEPQPDPITTPTPAPQPTEGALKAFYIGHSLQSDIPDMVDDFTQANNLAFQWKEQFIPGAPLRWQWDEQSRTNRQQFEPTFQNHYFNELPSGDYTALVLVDSVPRGGQSLVDESIEYLSQFHRYAMSHNPNTQVYFYEPWHCINSGTSVGCDYDTVSPTRTVNWRDRLTADLPMWERIIASVNSQNPGSKPIKLIPAAQGLAALNDAIENGEFTEFDSIEDVFDDTIHLNHYGKYFVALIHYATLSGQSPIGLPSGIDNRWGVDYWDTPNWEGKQWTAPSAQTIRRMQEIAWNVVRNYSPDDNPVPSPPAAQNICGNGLIETGESCDDGNTLNGDGCSATCSNEAAPPQDSGRSITIAPSNDRYLSWTTAGFPEDQNFLVIFSRSPEVTYPLEDGLAYFRTSQENDVWINPYDGPGTYYVRVCSFVLDQDRCDFYSDVVTAVAN